MRVPPQRSFLLFVGSGLAEPQNRLAKQFGSGNSRGMAIPVRGSAPLFQVFDMPASLAFYRDKLGFEVVERSGEGDDVDWVLLRLNNVELMLNTAYEKPNRPSAPAPARMAAHADTTLYFGCPDVDGAYHYLSSQKISVEKPTVAPYGMKQLYLADPDGYCLCFQWPATEETRRSWELRYGFNPAHNP